MNYVDVRNLGENIGMIKEGVLIQFSAEGFLGRVKTKRWRDG